MMKTSTKYPLYSATDFTWVGKRASAEASDLELFNPGKPTRYIQVKSPRTGITKEFALWDTVGAEDDVMAWVYRDNHNPEFVITIYND